MADSSMADFNWDVRVYYEDTDAGGIVFYANYLKFFERARTEWLRAAGIGQQALGEQDGRIFVVRSTAVDYFSPARLDDCLRLSVVVEKLGRASVDFFQEARRAGQDAVLCSGRIRVACVNAQSLKPAPIPARVMDKIAAMQATARQVSLQD
jgi:acyl-CoA thioester hydrolase